MKGFLFVFFLFSLSGCDLPNKGLVDTTPPPLIVQATSSPNVIDVNHLAVHPTDPVDTTIVFSVSVSNVDASTLVTYGLYDPDGSLLSAGTLLDNGVYPDLAPRDGKFSAVTHFHILKQDVGRYGIQFQAISNSEFKSNTLMQPLAVKNSNNHSPVISNLAMQDTAVVPPPGDTTFVKITLAVSDSEGLGDIVSVKLSSQRPDGVSAGQFNLYDDGGSVLYTQFGGPLASGDSAAGDGTYTIRIPLTVAPKDTPPTYRDFSFKATDRTGDFSNVITKRIYIIQQNP